MGWTLGAALAEGYRLGGLGHRSAGGGVFSASSWASPGPFWLLVGGASAAFLLWAAVDTCLQRRWLRPLSARGPGAGWLARVLRGGGKLAAKGSGGHLELTLDTPLSTDRSSISDLSSAPVTGRSVTCGWPPAVGPAAAMQLAAAAGADAHANGSSKGTSSARPRSLSWAALHDAPAGGSGPVQQEQGPPLSRLGRSRNFSRRNLASSDGDL